MREFGLTRRACVFSLLLAGALGCGGGGTDPDPDPVPTVVDVGPGETTVADGGTRQLTATVSDQQGRVMTGAAVAWTSRDGAVASVDANGLVTALRPGAVWVRASVGAVADSARVTVTAVPTQLAAVGSTSRAGTAGRRMADSLAVRVTDRHGTGMAGVTVAFATSGGGELSPASATTGADGTAKTAWRLGATPGEQAATATVAGVAGSPLTFLAAAAAPVPASVTIAPSFATLAVGGTAAFGATVRSADGEEIPGAAVAFASTQTGRAMVSGQTASGVAPGVAQVVASLGALADSATVAVLGPASILATAFPGGSIHANVQRGDTVRVPVVLDLSRPSPANELGSAQLDVVFDPGVLQFVRADDVLGNAVSHLRSSGRFALAFAATGPQAPGTVRLATLVLVVRGDAAAGAVSPFRLEFAEAPRSTSLVPYSDPIVVAGRVRVR